MNERADVKVRATTSGVRTVNGVRTSFVYDSKGKLLKTVTVGGPEPVGKDLQNCSFCGSNHDPMTGEIGEPGEP